MLTTILIEVLKSENHYTQLSCCSLKMKHKCEIGEFKLKVVTPYKIESVLRNRLNEYSIHFLYRRKRVEMEKIMFLRYIYLCCQLRSVVNVRTTNET